VRAKDLERFLAEFKSPIGKESLAIVEIADKYDVDYKILIGIAGAESLFETTGNIKDFNPYGVDCPGTTSCRSFKSFAEATEFLAKTIMTNKAYVVWQESGNLDDLASVYLTGDRGRWTTTVRSYIQQQIDKDYER